MLDNLLEKLLPDQYPAIPERVLFRLLVVPPQRCFGSDAATCAVLVLLVLINQEDLALTRRGSEFRPVLGAGFCHGGIPPR